MRAAADMTRNAEKQQQQQQQRGTTTATTATLPPPPTLKWSPIPVAPGSGASGSGVVAHAVQPHSSTPQIPYLSSAPPSGNFPPTMSLLPPPPPPPPKRGTTTTAAATKTSPNPTIVSLPPLSPSKTAGPPSLSSFLGATTPPGKTTVAAEEEDDVTVPASNRTPVAAAPSASAVVAERFETEDATTLPTTATKTTKTGWTAPPPPATPQRIVRLPPTRPPALPFTAFSLPKSALPGPSSSSSPASSHQQQQQQQLQQQPQPLLAFRQASFPVLLVATESAHRMAWKNQLLLHDLLNGLMHTVTQTQTTPMPPFRSVTRSWGNFEWSDWPVVFYDALWPLQDEDAQELLQQAAALQPSDGNLTRELDILEDQVDQLLLPTLPLSLQQDECLINNQNWFEQRQRQSDQVTRDAFSLTSPLTLPWMRRYRHALDYVTQHQPYDLTCCPAVCLYVCTTSEIANPIDTLRGLQQIPHYLPQQFQNGLWDPDALSKHVLVLHDQIEGPRNDWDEMPLRLALQDTFGKTAALCRINTNAPETAEVLAAEETNDLWHGQGRKGNCLSVSDRVILRNYLIQFVTTVLQPALEKRIARLDAIVSERKKGVRNVLKSFWRAGTNTNTKDDTAESANNKNSMVRYRFDSVESQTRLLADTLFLIRDYESALATYRLIRDDYKQDKAHAHYASCQEMMALCMHQQEPYGRARDVFSCLETALLSYKKAAAEEDAAKTRPPGQRAAVSPPSTRNATRLCLVLLLVVAATSSDPSSNSSSTAAVQSGRYLEVADLLASASSNETALGAAVLLEQASTNYYKDEKFRKYAFHMLMSGHMFRSAEQEHHAFRCFTSALHIYRDAQWDELHNHVRSALAAQLYSMGRMALSLQLYAKLVGCRPRVSVKSQQKFVNHVLEICNEHPKKALAGADRMVHPIELRRERLQRITQVIRYTKTAARVLELPNMQLPFIDDDSILVVAEEGGNVVADAETSHRATIGRVERGDPDVWTQLELETIAELRAADSGGGSSSTGGGGTTSSNNANNNNNNNKMDDSKNNVGAVVETKVLSRIEDRPIRKMIAEIDREKAQRNLAERARKAATYKEAPPVRALQEPLAVEFVVRNPLGIPIDLNDLQIVARMTSSLSGGGGAHKQVCTNEDAIQITPLASHNELRTWSFFSCNTLEFSVPHFARVSQPSSPPTETASTTRGRSHDGGDDDNHDSSSSSSPKHKWKSAYEVEPFFVVTKTAITLPPESAQTISASVCPLVEGDIEILGIRYRLFDDIWTYHPFSVKGELLQNTRSNRIKRVRAESLLLKAKVERGMPCLTADLIRPLSGTGDSGPLLQGQVAKWNLRITNVGTAPAKSITLKTNLPWISVWDGGDEDSPSSTSLLGLERQATSYSVGPSGTLLRIPIDGFGLRVDGEIAPGETVDVAVDVRTFGAGRQEFYMLYRYELVEQDSASVPFRWLRKMVEVPLYPSLTVNASVVPSYAKDAEHVLSVEITNYRSDRPDQLYILIDKITLASRSYKLERIPGQIAVNSKGRCEVRLGWQERATLHFRIVPLEEEEDSSICWLSQSCLEGVPDAKTISIPASSSSMLNFLCLERAHAQFLDTWSSHQRALARAVVAAQGHHHHEDRHPLSIADIRRANTTSSNVGAADHDNILGDGIVAPTSIRKLTPLDTSSSLAYAILVCSWKSEDGMKEGQHHIRGLSIRPMTNDSNSNNSGCPIVITGKHPSLVTNNFDQGPAHVPLEVTLWNRLVKSSVKFEFSAEQADDFDWTGMTRLEQELTGGEQLRVTLEAVIPCAGVYNIQRVRITLLAEDEDTNENEAISYLFPLQWNVVVSQQQQNAA